MSDKRLSLSAEVTTANGTRFRWGPNEPAGSRIKNLSFSTKIGEGFSSATGSLARRIDLDYPDLNLVDTVAFIGADGSVAWEGRVSAMPRELGDSHSIGLTLTGWMAHAKDRKFQEVYVDRDLSAWQTTIPRARRLQLLSGSSQPKDATQTTDGTGAATIETSWDGGWASGFQPVSEAWYDAGPLMQISKVAYAFVRGANVANIVPWSLAVACTNDAAGASFVTSTGNIVGGSGALAELNPTVPTRYALIQMTYGVTPAGSDGIHYNTGWERVAVYGNHGLLLYTGEPNQPSGVLASDVIKNIAGRWCPQLDTSGIVDSGYVIQHLAFKDRTFPFDAFLEVNKYHLWNLAVWENKKLHYRPYNLEDYDWEIRTDDQGTTFSPQGDSVDALFNGISVKYTDALTGIENILTPELFPDDLATSDVTNPWNAHGVNHWDEIVLSTPTIQPQALQLGRAALADRNTPKNPGTITVEGFIRDRQGAEQPVWKVRAGDTISVTNFPNDTPRLIVETDYDDEQKQISLSIDRPFALLDAYLDRVGTALTARGLS